MTTSKLKRLAAKFAVAAKNVTIGDACSYWYNDYKGIKAMLRSMGLKYTIIGKWTKVIKVEGLNVILKRRSGLSDGQLPSKDYCPWMLKHIIPTADFEIPDGHHDFFWVVQPLALRDNHHKAKAYHYFTDSEGGCKDWAKLSDYDIHTGNVGWYNDKPVLIDW
jgi:hypothetical protein